MRRTAGVLMASLLTTTSALAGAACGGGGDKDDAAAGSPFEPVSEDVGGESTTSSTGRPVDEARVTIGETVRYAAFRFELGDAVLAPSESALDVEGSPDPSVAQLTIDAVVENLGEDDTAPDQTQMYLEVGGEPLSLDTYAFEALPVVPAGETGNVEMVFDGLPGDIELDNTELVFGDGDVNQARVPLGGEGEIVALEPIDITPGASGQAGEVTITVNSGQLIYDDPVFHQSLPSGEALMLVDFAVTTGPGLTRLGGVVFGAENIRLVLPDGTSLATESFSDIGEVLGTSATYDGQFARFAVPADLRGSFQLALRGPFAAPGGGVGSDAEGSATFDLTD